MEKLLTPLLLLGGAGSENAIVAKPPASSVLVRIPDRLKCVGVEVEAVDMDLADGEARSLLMEAYATTWTEDRIKNTHPHNL